MASVPTRGSGSEAIARHRGSRKTTLPGDGAERGTSRGRAGLGAGARGRRTRSPQCPHQLGGGSPRLPGRTWLRAGCWHPAPSSSTQGTHEVCKEQELFLVSFHSHCTTAGCVVELPDDNSRIHWGKVTLGWHRSDLGRALSPGESLPKQPLRDAPLHSLFLSRSSQPVWVPGCRQTGGQTAALETIWELHIYLLQPRFADGLRLFLGR